MRLRPVAERDEALREHLETTHFFDERTGELDPTEVPPDPDPDPEDDDDGPT